MAMCLMVLGALKAHFHYSLNPTANHTKCHQGGWHMHTKTVQGGTGVATRTGHHSTPSSRGDGRVV